MLRRVHLLDGRLVEDDDELGDLEVVPRRRAWHECERSEVLDDLADGFPSQRLEIVLERSHVTCFHTEGIQNIWT